MRKLITGAAILLLIFCLSIINANNFTQKIGILEDHVIAASKLCSTGDCSDAIIILEKAVEKWEEMSSFTRKSINQNSVDEITEAFYEYMDLIDRAGRDAVYRREKLLQTLRAAAEQEKLSCNSIF